MSSTCAVKVTTLAPHAEGALDRTSRSIVSSVGVDCVGPDHFQPRLPASSRIGSQLNALTGPNDRADATETAARPSYDEQTDWLLTRAASWPPGCIVLPLVRGMIRNGTFSG